MLPQFTSEEFDKAKTNDKLPCKCIICKNIFLKTKRDIRAIYNKNPNTHYGSGKYCSQKCYGIDKTKKQLVSCDNCQKSFVSIPSQIKKSKLHFCSQHCFGYYNTTHKSHGTRRSKLETWIEEQLSILYPDLEIHYNQKTVINSELDIYIPSLSLAFELNGIFHYEPIFGETKLNQVQENDNNKSQNCTKNNISLCIINVTSQGKFNPKTGRQFLEIITNTINNCQRKR